MTDTESAPPDDPWMTIAEFAEELRVRPVTVRSWIAKGQISATRAGQRKWLVRRSEVERMLGQDANPVPAIPPPLSSPLRRSGPLEYPDEVPGQMAARAAEDERGDRERWFAMASYEWEVALDQSRMAPPDARFVGRIRQIAQAAAGRAAAIRDCMSEPEFVWEPRALSDDMTLSYELRPGGNRPGPKDRWERVDRVVARLGAAMTGSSASAVARAFSDLARAMNDVADAIEKRPARVASNDEDGGATMSEGAE